ncbi:hypothetical protein JRQ81_011158 [Phrynocephalus forsythii]|uniref:Uncharacterized protein n=1 Tax=Phrynocephalus forsythii TaxID=171643 RepID=A0A9Q0X7X6_9SAUR|nr:hypothetical protein JRQ81_011158 [Phrynocephalus forsythii]
MPLTSRKARLSLSRRWWQILEQVVAEPTPGNILPCALEALHHLSKICPRTPWELEDRFLSLAIHAVLRLEEPSYDYVGQIMGDALGRYVAELGVCLMDPKRQVGRHAREGIYRLYELALQQRGIDIRDMAGLWIREPNLDWEMASYLNTMRTAEVRRPPGLVPGLPSFLPRRAGDVLIDDLEEEEVTKEEEEEAQG